MLGHPAKLLCTRLRADLRLEIKRGVDLYGALIGLIGVALGSLLTGYYTLHA